LLLLLGICLVFLLQNANAGKLKIFAAKGPLGGGFVKVKARTPKLLGLKHALVAAALVALEEDMVDMAVVTVDMKAIRRTEEHMVVDMVVALEADWEASVAASNAVKKYIL